MYVGARALFDIVWQTCDYLGLVFKLKLHYWFVDVQIKVLLATFVTVI